MSDHQMSHSAQEAMRAYARQLQTRAQGQAEPSWQAICRRAETEDVQGLPIEPNVHRTTRRSVATIVGVGVLAAACAALWLAGSGWDRTDRADGRLLGEAALEEHERATLTTEEVAGRRAATRSPSDQAAPSEYRADPFADPLPDSVQEAVVDPLAHPHSASDATDPAARSRRSRKASAPSASTRQLDTVLEEADLIRRARQLLTQGDSEAAINVLERHRAQFRRGSLVQQREVLRIEALCALGRSKQARRAAKTFVRRYAGSPYNARVSEMCSSAGE